jgi:hypothetical protein
MEILIALNVVWLITLAVYLITLRPSRSTTVNEVLSIVSSGLCGMACYGALTFAMLYELIRHAVV